MLNETAGHASVGAAFADELIGETVRRAFDAPFYAQLYGAAGLGPDVVGSVSELHRLPITDKEMLRQAGRSVLCGRYLSDLSHIQHTSGTTAAPFLIHRSRAEAKFIHDFFTGLNSGAVTSKSPVPLMLQTQLADHGVPTSVPAHLFVLPFSVGDEYLVDHALHFLGREFDLPGVESRVSIISGNQTPVLVLTNYAIEKGINCRADFEVKAIHVHGRYLTRRWRNVLETTWGAAVHDRYSTGEIFGGANDCSGCGGYHFDPLVVPELVTSGSRQPVEVGTGVLLLTSLFPFVQLQPMIRYSTDDLFDVRPSICPRPSFWYRGRVSHTLFDPADPDVVLLTGVDVIEAIESTPAVSRGTRFRDLVRAQYQQAGGEIRVKGIVELGRGRLDVRIVIELVFPPELYPDRAHDIRTGVEERLLHCSATLSEGAADDRITLSVSLVGPGALDPMMKFRRLWVHQWK